MKYLSLGEIWAAIEKELPEVKELSEIASDGSRIISTITKAREIIIKNKIRIFVENLNKSSNESIKQYLNSIKEDENKKVLFLEALNKVIDLDDNLQIYVLAHLVKRYNTNNELNYWEKSIYYNIKQISEDDYLLLFEFLETIEKPIKINEIYGLSKDIKDETVIVIKKLENIGILNIQVGGFASECINLPQEDDYSVAFSFYTFINDLYLIIKSFKLDSKG